MQKIPALDGLRGLAALAVLFFHAGLAEARGGALGVDVFFVLSGFLITSLATQELDRTGGLDLRRFFSRRARRLIPALAVLLAVYVVAAPWIAPRYADLRWKDAAFAALYLTNFVEAARPTYRPLSHTWSLAVEAHFYLIWPFALLWIGRLSRGRAALLVGALWLGVTVARIAWMELGGYGGQAYYSTFFHCTGLLLGAAVALSPWRASAGAAGRLGWAGLAGFAALTVFGGRLGYVYEAPLAEIAAALIVLGPPGVLAWRPLTALGLVSYGVYLWHVPLNHALGGSRGWGEALVLAAASVAAATVSYVLVERRFVARRPQPSEASGGAPKGLPVGEPGP